ILQEGEAKGEIEEAKKILVLLARKRFGEPPAQALAAIAAVSDVKKLEDLSVRLLGATSWQDLPASTAHAVAAGKSPRNGLSQAKEPHANKCSTMRLIHWAELHSSIRHGSVMV
ncbi:MAG TPA: DUF4351 domain-containing protein, partial [Gemmataceae bacterium]